MPMFRKKPVVVEAVQFDGTTKCADAIRDWGKGSIDDYWGPGGGQLIVRIKTLEGVMEAHKGDWIIKGVKGEFYPCKPDIFAATYDAVPAEKPSDGIRRCGECN